MQRLPKKGDVLVYRKTKHSTRPGPRAQGVHPAPSGDNYSYFVDKFWIVSHIGDDGTLVLKTRAGKIHEVSADDPNLRAVSLWDRLRFGSRFPTLEQP